MCSDTGHINSNILWKAVDLVQSSLRRFPLKYWTSRFKARLKSINLLFLVKYQNRQITNLFKSLSDNMSLLHKEPIIFFKIETLNVKQKLNNLICSRKKNYICQKKNLLSCNFRWALEHNICISCVGGLQKISRLVLVRIIASVS